jgi:hypothetical protein
MAVNESIPAGNGSHRKNLFIGLDEYDLTGNGEK